VAFPELFDDRFHGRLRGGELRKDPEEIEDAGWYSVDELPVLPPRVSIARAMIDQFVAELAEHGGDPETLETPG
jgi:NAD+ diphosphatase